MDYKIITTFDIQKGPRFWANITLEHLKNSAVGTPRYKANVSLYDMGEFRGTYQFIIKGYQGEKELAEIAYYQIKEELGL